MVLLRNKIKLKCDGGQAVSIGSVFCPHCRAAIEKKNDKVIKREESRYQRRVRGKGKKK